MTLFVESSALLKRYVLESGTPVVLAEMDRDREWIASALAHAEAALTLCYTDLTDDQRREARRSLDEDWHRFRVMPTDHGCLQRAIEIGCRQRTRTLDAIHLAAADRLPRPLTFLTFDRRQAAAARALGFEVVGADG